MRRIVSIITLAVGATLVASGVLAVGGGSGGSTPTCAADTWSCTDWSTCSTAGRQVRTCTLTFDCSTANTPKPDEEQSCTPPVANTNAGDATTDSPSTGATNTSRPAVTNTAAPSPACGEDTWTCGDWSADCDADGRQERACSLTDDCPAVATRPPEQFRSCQRLQCGRLATLRERVRCRLNLTPAGLTRELEIEYLPEECRTQAEGDARQACIRYYRGYQPCWSEPVGEGRFACARRVLNIGQSVRELAQACRGQTGQARADCAGDLQNQVYDLIKFRFYDLEQRAEGLGERGADLDAVADFITTVEGKKQAFDAAPTTAERRQLILNVRQAWRAFLDRVRDQTQ
ncbi:MAG: hypothetical protein HYZ09_01405 [Candidatus Kerfeldbacteria bacterium]|nr:hypothetical protein [Candidatus Kerfeldbacteria bacterium]